MNGKNSWTLRLNDRIPGVLHNPLHATQRHAIVTGMKTNIRRQRRDKGLCMDCGGAAPPDHTIPGAARRALSEGRSVAACSGEGKQGWTYERISTYGYCEKCETKRTATLQKKADRRKRDSTRMMAFRATRIAAGLCVECGKEPPKDGRQCCATCTDNKRVAMQASRQARSSRGRCADCGRRSVQASRVRQGEVSTRCDRCQEKRNHQARERRAVAHDVV